MISNYERRILFLLSDIKELLEKANNKNQVLENNNDEQENHNSITFQKEFLHIYKCDDCRKRLNLLIDERLEELDLYKNKGVEK
jgi:uncharacterized protein YlaI